MIAVVSVDAYPFLAFSDLSCHLKIPMPILKIHEYVFSGCTVLLDSKETELGSSNQEAGKNTTIVLVPCHAWKCAPTAISSGLDTSEVPGCHLLQKMSFQ